jgi:inhibitor of KinA
VLSLQPLGDQAVLVTCPDEASALHLSFAVRRAAPPWLIDVVQAYTSLAAFFDPDRIRYAAAAEFVSGLSAAAKEDVVAEGKRHHIPCCYEMQFDLSRAAEHTRLSADDVVRLHTATEYTVYAIGFCPGFPYLGYLPPRLCGVQRLASPRLRVEAGSVGLTGRQTGIYTEPRPGGWNLVGRTPLTLVDVADGYFPLCTGDRVQFDRIDEAEFRRLKGERL